MKPSKPFLLVLAGIAVAAFVIVETPRAVPAQAQDSMPMSTKLTPAMIDYFALDVAFERPSIAALVSCKAVPACGASDEWHDDRELPELHRGDPNASERTCDVRRARYASAGSRPRPA
jgi:hypothetical protein